MRYEVGCVLVNLTGPRQKSVWTMRSGAFGGIGKSVKVKVETMSLRRAAGSLRAVAGGKLSRAFLAFSPLMQGGGEVGTIRRWRELVEQEPDPRRRADYAGLALVFANLAGCLPAWKQGLETMNVERSVVTLEWEQRGVVKARRTDLVEVLDANFPGQPCDDLKAAITSQTDPTILQRWFSLALRAGDLEEIRRVITAP